MAKFSAHFARILTAELATDSVKFKYSINSQKKFGALRVPTCFLSVLADGLLKVTKFSARFVRILTAELAADSVKFKY